MIFEGRWNAWTTQIGAPKAAADRWLTDLAGRYAEPQRHYHNTSHIADLLEKFEPLVGSFRQPDEVLAALYFHDAIYEIGKADNEALSARLAEEALPELGFATESVKQVTAMIEATASHAATGDADTDLFIDLDMSILAAPRGQYEIYARNVMAEFTTVFSKPDYVTGRIALFLEPTLKQERLFLTKQYRPQEEAARQNMAGEIEWLRRDAPDI